MLTRTSHATCVFLLLLLVLIAGCDTHQDAGTSVMPENTGRQPALPAEAAGASLKAFHMQSAMDYVASATCREQPGFQRFIASRADALEAQGIHIDLME